MKTEVELHQRAEARQGKGKTTAAIGMAWRNDREANMSVLHAPLTEVIVINPRPDKGWWTRDAGFVNAEQIRPEVRDVSAHSQRGIDLPQQHGFFQARDLLLPDSFSKLAAGAVCQVKADLPYGYHIDKLLTLRTDPNRLDARFLLHFLRQRRMANKISEWRARQDKRKESIRSFLRHLTIPLPPLAQQYEQVAELERCQDQCRQLEADLLALNNQRRLLFRKVMGSTLDLREQFPASTLPELRISLQMGPPPGAQTIQHTGFGLHLILPASLGVARLCKGDPVCIPYDSQPHPNREVRTGDVLIATGANTGRTAVVNRADLPAVIGPGVALLRAKQGEARVLPGYLAHYLASGTAIGKLAELITGRPNQKITRDDLTELPIHVPPLALQAEFIAKGAASLPEIDEAERQWRQACKQLAALEQQAFGT